MPDIKSPEERSRNMAAIRSKNTQPELYLRRMLFSEGYRYRICPSNIAGHPDIWLKRCNTAIFVHGCYWHRHNGCKFAYMPKSRVDFWTTKFEQNKARDTLVRKSLADERIKCLVVWECSIKRARKNDEFFLQFKQRVVGFLNQEELFLEI